VILALADAVTAQLNAGDFSQEFTAERVYQRPASEENDTAFYDTLRVLVAPGGIDTSLAARTKTDDVVTVDVHVTKREAEAANLDALVGLVQELADSFRFVRLTELPEAAWIGSQIDPVFDADQLSTRRTFSSTVTLSYRLIR
jgi:hypothetical protein